MLKAPAVAELKVVEALPEAMTTLVEPNDPPVEEKVALLPFREAGNVAVTVILVDTMAVSELALISTGVATMPTMVAFSVATVALSEAMVASLVPVVPPAAAVAVFEVRLSARDCSTIT